MLRVRQIDDSSRASVTQAIVPKASMEAFRANRPRLLDQLQQVLRSRHYIRWTEQTYCHWVKRFIYFHSIRRLVETSTRILFTRRL